MAGDRPNVLSSAELKRRGIAAIEEALRGGPVHLMKRNRPAAVVMSEEHYWSSPGFVDSSHATLRVTLALI
jgi:hypothetical protein